MYDQIYLHRFLWGYLVVFKISNEAEVVTSPRELVSTPKS
jgi:hypothetical protein